MAHVPAAERRPQLVQAAIDLMAREGVPAGSTRAIAAELGVAQATVHYTFGTKKDLYRAVVEQLMADFIGQVRAAAPGEGPFGEQVRALVHALWASTTGEPGRCILLAELETLAMRDPGLQDIMRGLQDEMERTAAGIITALAEAHGQPLARPAHDIAVHFLAGFDGLCGRYLVLRDAGPAAEAEAVRALDLLVAATVDLCAAPPA
ncbi:TetR family transcriptional regulator [Kitasatospora sp. NPDC088351]|uniref:TetR/AcrR family transcriptional regulator n=1 Tax=Kitasatospora sp. NPDC088351 TaxID=3155180 RepID=UPI003431AA72